MVKQSLVSCAMLDAEGVWDKSTSDKKQIKILNKKDGSFRKVQMADNLQMKLDGLGIGILECGSLLRVTSVSVFINARRAIALVFF